MSRTLIAGGSSLVLFAFATLADTRGNAAGPILDDRWVAAIHGADQGKYQTLGDCALFSVRSGEVPALGGCVGAPFPTLCLRCAGGYYSTYQTTNNGNGNVHKASLVDCSTLVAWIGLCDPVTNNCRDQEESGFCDGSDYNYPFQTAP